MMVKRFFGTFFVFFIAVGCYAQKYPVFTHADTLRGMLTPERSCYNVYFYDLHLKINPDDQSISGYNTIYFKGVKSFDEMQIDLIKNMIIDSIVFRTYHLEYKRDSNAVFINSYSSKPLRLDSTIKYEPVSAS